MAIPAVGAPDHPASAPVDRYVAAVAISVAAILSQYFVPPLFPAADVLYRYAATGWLIVYGIPIVAFLVLVGLAPLRRWHHRMVPSAPVALGWYGALSAVSLVVTVGLVIAYMALDPSALKLLDQQNPVLTAAAPDPWLWVGLAFVIGVVEETIFRGWVFGYWVQRGSPSLLAHAIWTSALFAGLHLYYGTTYLAASPLIYPQLFFLGLAFALAVRSSSGNLVWVALLHGATDATSFLTLVNPDLAGGLRYGLIGVGAIIAIYLYLRERPSEPVPSWHAPGPPPMWGPSYSTPSSYPPPYSGPPPAVPVVPPPVPPPPPPPG